MTESFLADTYALIEIIEGNPNYEKYTDYNLCITELNLIELYYAILRKRGKEQARHYLEEWDSFTTGISLESIRFGMQFKLLNKKDKLSYTDCIGYALAMEKNIKFLTGDEKFEGLANVEFVK
ncbi:MAG TPA: PIN domain-containing protein [Candidatus Nanoarchaeia archaeon]|nr:PIN domain-containing protein [Candidatus Nanoarchaeia archaeon]